VVKEVIAHCEADRFRFAVIDCEPNQAVASRLDPRVEFASRFAAYYYPWILVSDPLTGGRIKVPPGGSVCGIYARTDAARGVFVAPAGQPIKGALDLEFKIDGPTQEILNPRGVNVLRGFPGRGILVWGARTLSADPEWKYVNVRRYFNYVEESIEDGTQWVVFEPNDERTWARVRQSVYEFLMTQWRQGGLIGTKPEEAFFVRVDRTTMTENDVLNGRMIIEIGMAPVRPAEFVIFRIGQKTSDSRS
jgi:hypothetical protein